MSDELIVLDLLKDDGTLEQEQLPLRETELNLSRRQLVSVPDEIAQLTRVTVLWLNHNALAEVLASVLAMTQLTLLALNNNHLSALPPAIGQLRALRNLDLDNNRIVALPAEIGRLRALQVLSAADNALTSLPAELGQLLSLETVFLRHCQLAWLPMSLTRLLLSTVIYVSGCCVSIQTDGPSQLNGNPLPIAAGYVGGYYNARSLLPEIFATTTSLSMIRAEATTIAIGLQDLALPALVTLEIIDAAFPNSIPMHKKWDLVTAVKHYHQRRAH